MPGFWSYEIVTTGGSFSVPLICSSLTISTLFIDVRDHGHPGLKLRIPARHGVTDLVRTNLALRQYPVQPRPAQFGQARMTGAQTVLSHVILQ